TKRAIFHRPRPKIRFLKTAPAGTPAPGHPACNGPDHHVFLNLRGTYRPCGPPAVLDEMGVYRQLKQYVSTDFCKSLQFFRHSFFENSILRVSTAPSLTLPVNRNKILYRRGYRHKVVECFTTFVGTRRMKGQK